MSRWFWSAASPAYDAMWDGPASGSLSELVRDISKGQARLLDIGCGTGLASRGARADGLEVIGVDSSPGMLRRALALGRISRGVSLESAWDLSDGWADIGVMTNVLHIATDPESLLALAERKVRPGGSLVVSWPRHGLTVASMLRIDLAQGRGWRASAIAHVLRHVVGLLAIFAAAGRRRRSTCVRRLREFMDGAPGWEEPREATIAGCQEVLIVRRRAGRR